MISFVLLLVVLGTISMIALLIKSQHVEEGNFSAIPFQQKVQQLCFHWNLKVMSKKKALKFFLLSVESPARLTLQVRIT